MIDQKSSKILLVLLHFSFVVNCLQIERPNVRESSFLTAAHPDLKNLVANGDRSRSQYGYGGYPGYGFGGYGGGNGYYDRYPGYYTTQRTLLDLIFPRQTPSYYNNRYNRYYDYPPYYTTVGFPFNLFTTTPPPFPFNLFATNPPFLGIGRK